MVCGASDYQRKDYAEKKFGATALDGVFFWFGFCSVLDLSQQAGGGGKRSSLPLALLLFQGQVQVQNKCLFCMNLNLCTQVSLLKL